METDRGRGDHWLQVPWKLCTNNAEVLRDAAVNGRGIALLPTFTASAELKHGKLRPLLAGYHAPEPALYALYSSTRYLSVKVGLFIDFRAARAAILG